MCQCSWTYTWLARKRISLIVTDADFRIPKTFFCTCTPFLHLHICMIAWEFCAEPRFWLFLYCLLSCGFEFCSMFSKVTVPKVLFLYRRFSLWTNLTIFDLFTPSLKFDLCTYLHLMHMHIILTYLRQTINTEQNRS